MRRAAIIASFMLAAGCASEKKAAYQRFADELNPILVTLILNVAAIKALGPLAEEDDPRLAMAWTASDAALERISDIQIEDRSIDPGLRMWAGQLRLDRHTLCRWEPGATRPARTCRFVCLGGWSLITQRVAKLEASARAEGVYVMALPQVAGPPKIDE